jgi:hypothetical protein
MVSAPNQAAEMTTELEQVKAELEKARECVRAIKIRLHFMDWPAESFWNAGSEESPWWISDWRYEIGLIENVLHGTPITQPEKPDDTQPANVLAEKGLLPRAWKDPDNAQPLPPGTQAFLLGHEYKTLGGDTVKLVTISNGGTDYECMADEAGVHRYTRRFNTWEFGRTTGSPIDCPKNLVPVVRRFK